MSRTSDQQWAIDLCRTWADELAQPGLAPERLAQAPGELQDLANWLAELWPGDETVIPVPPLQPSQTLEYPVDGQWPINTENPFGANPELYVSLGYLGHPGVDFVCPDGSPVYASEAGIVKLARLLGSAGNAIRIGHDWCDTRYCHLSAFNVSEGQQVDRGDQIGSSGGTPGTPGAGFTTGPHLHWDVFPHSEPADNGYGGRVDGATYLG